MSWFEERKEALSEGLLKKRRALLLTGVCGVVLCVFLVIAFKDPTQKREHQEAAPVKLVTPNTLISDQERWVDRISKDQEKMDKKVAAVATQNQELVDRNKILEARLEMMDAVLKGVGGEGSSASQGKASPPSDPSFFPSSSPSTLPRSRPSETPVRIQKEGPRMLHLTRGEAPRELPKTVESYVPAGTYVPAILTSGVVASTSTDAQGDPMPIMLRLVGNGTLPRGFRSDLKEAVLIGSCYGDLSSERANCRLHKLTLTERNGEIFESPIEGWILGEDGRPGIKGDVVDRAGKIAREAMAAGILSGMAGFFKQQSTSTYSPASLVTPQKALETQDIVKGGAATGVGNALEKLANFSIARAEKMQPVILVASGRRVDVVFKEGVTLLGTATRQELKRVGQGARLKKAQEGARQANLQGLNF